MGREFIVDISVWYCSKSLSRWPSGPRRRLQVPFLFGGREFEPRFRYVSEFASTLRFFTFKVVFSCFDGGLGIVRHPGLPEMIR